MATARIISDRFMAVAKSQALDILANGETIPPAVLAERIRAQGLSGTMTVGDVELRLEPLSPSIGTVVHGVDLANLTPELIGVLKALWLQRKVLFFRGQAHLTRQQHTGLADMFGVRGAHHGERDWVPENQFANLETATPAGFPDLLYIHSDERSRSAAASWHSDVMWSTRPPMASMLFAKEVPPIGGDTCFCDMYAMWEGLPEETREQLAGRYALHIGGPVHTKGGIRPRAEHPVARTHPETGCTGLYVSLAFTKKILGLPKEESDKLLQICFNQAGRPEYSCRFKWEVGSLAFWDNRACFHYATPDSWPYTRRLERVTVLDRDESKKVPYFAPATRAKL